MSIVSWRTGVEGAPLYFLDPEKSSLTMRELADCLSHINHYNGHAGGFSVAQHSVEVMRLLPPDATRRARGAALLHDGEEVVFGDLHPWIKCQLPGEVQDATKRWQNYILDKFGRGQPTPREAAQIKHADQLVFAWGVRDLLSSGGRINRNAWPSITDAHLDEIARLPRIVPLGPDDASHQFYMTWVSL